MTRFEELQAIINKNKNKDKPSADSTEGDPLEVPGVTDSTKGGNPRIEFATEEQDADLIDMLYTKPKNIPNRGENASYWDQD